MNKQTVQKYKELAAFHPGYYIAEIIDDMGITQEEFATRLDTTPKTISTLVNGQIALSNDIARKLSLMLGTEVEVWQNLQKKYESMLLEIETEKQLDFQREIVQQIDYRYFVKFMFLPLTKKIGEKIRNLCSYFKISDLSILARPDFLVNFRKNVPEFQLKNIINSQAWLQTALNQSAGIKTKSFNIDKLRSYLPEIKSMTIQSPDIFLPRLKEIFAECGVAFVLLPHLRNSGICGAVKWVRKDTAVLAMNNRGLYADRFWFSLFHEIEHILQHKTKETFISWGNETREYMDAKYEKEADRFAADYLIPPDAFKAFNPSARTSDKEIKEFAKQQGIHAGIVVGRLQHDKIIAQNRGARLKEKYNITWTQTKI